MSYLLIALVLTAGTAFLIWLGDQITQFGVGNGIFIIIFAGILSTLPASLIQFGTNCVRWARRYIISMVESIRTFSVTDTINCRCYLCT
ncbi:hypothetical protein ACVQ9Z_01800 [Staphylococcus aureus]